MAKDVCAALEMSNSRVAISALDDDEKGVSQVYTPGGNQRVATISKPGVYRLVMRSDKPIAREFQRWLAHTVLPSFEKHGAYIVGQEHEMDPKVLVAKALIAAQSIGGGHFVQPNACAMYNVPETLNFLTYRSPFSTMHSTTRVG